MRGPEGDGIRPCLLGGRTLPQPCAGSAAIRPSRTARTGIGSATVPPGRSLQRGCLLATLFGLVGRYTGRLLTTTLGWASTLLFGRIPQCKQVLLAGATFGSLVWAVLLEGVALATILAIAQRGTGERRR